jgi:hypothetical protein
MDQPLVVHGASSSFLLKAILCSHGEVEDTSNGFAGRVKNRREDIETEPRGLGNITNNSLPLCS